MNKKVITVFKTHFDNGFTGLAEEVLKEYTGDILKAAVETCEKTSGNPEAIGSGERLFCLNGKWEAGVDRIYDKTVTVPGLVTDPKEVTVGQLWYRKNVELPYGEWSHATLTLKGARFCPSVFVNGCKVSECSGGMTVTTHLLKSEGVRPGNSITIEIALKSLQDVGDEDASKIPSADHWRSNISSCLWDDVIIRFHGPARITRIIPYIDIKQDRISVHWEAERRDGCNTDTALGVEFLIMDNMGHVLVRKQAENIRLKDEVDVALSGALKPWSPEAPNCYRLRTMLKDGEKTLDQIEMTLGMKEFGIEGLKFKLNDSPVTLRAGSVVWHRWLRDPEAEKLAFDYEWFEKNIVLRLKSHGANTLRFHLGTPPEALLDLCDKHGLIVQNEWLFFHSMRASEESLLEQWRHWLDLCMRHPSICLIHPWNETEGDELETAFRAIEKLASEYPPLVISHRDVIHVHKYWWSLFENVGLYYDSAEQFEKPIMVDEFGGNYLDGEGNMGGYPTVREAMLRFLGINHTKETRLELNTTSNTKIAEYWRRIGAAGFSPFCLLGSPEDGSHHFLGKLAEGRPKPVWEGLTAAYSPLSVSLEVWDRNYLPEQKIELPVYFFNDTGEDALLKVAIGIMNKQGEEFHKEYRSIPVPAHSMEKASVNLTLPNKEGEWSFQAILQNPPAGVIHPVVSEWAFRTLTIKLPERLLCAKVAILGEEKELLDFLKDRGLNICNINEADIVLTGRTTWEKIAQGKGTAKLQSIINRVCSVVMLDIGPMELGQGYLAGGDLGPLQSVMQVENPEVVETELFHGLKLVFGQMPEPESHIHPAESDVSLWENLDRQAAWLWNGLRGGLIVPARDMELTGMSADAFVSLWKNRGADEGLMENSDSYYAYELAGYYAFSREKNEFVSKQLRDRVKFLVEDAPALQISINPNAMIKTYNLAELYRRSKGAKAQCMITLAVAGKNLSRTPAVMVEFDKSKGKLLLSQLITKGRLYPGYGQDGLYGLRPDPVAGQFVLNMLARVLN